MDDERDEEEKDLDDFPGTKGRSKGGSAFDDDDPVDVDDHVGLDDTTESLDALAEEEDMDDLDVYEDSDLL